MSLSKPAIVDVLRQEGLLETTLCVHSSYRSFGHVEGGPAAVIEALLEEGNSVMVPTFTVSMRVPPPIGIPLPVRNGMDYSQPEYEEHAEVFHPDSESIDSNTMGAIPATLLRIPGRSRGKHPTNSFSAAGPAAERLVTEQTAANIWAPLEELVRQNGTVILMGVGYDRMTLLHLAERMVGRPSFIRWVNDGRGSKLAVSAGTCSLGFNRLAPAIDPYVRNVQVGSSLWTLCPAQQVLEAAVRAIANDPHITHCNDPTCRRCGDLLQGGPFYI
jgi:aminoglycoside N3'-acetyltransferase